MSDYREVEIVRDSLNTPWGLRLFGGSDHNAPLSIGRVAPCGAATGHLRAGDILVSINGYSTQRMKHGEAASLIGQSGSHLRLGIAR